MNPKTQCACPCSGFNLILDFGVPLIFSIFLCIFRLLQQERIHFRGFNQKTPLNIPIFCIQAWLQPGSGDSLVAACCIRQRHYRSCKLHYISKQGKNGREKEKRKTENDVTGLDDESGLQQVEGESWTSWWMAQLDRTNLPRKAENQEEKKQALSLRPSDIKETFLYYKHHILFMGPISCPISRSRAATSASESVDVIETIAAATD